MPPFRPLKRTSDEARFVETRSRPLKRNFSFPIATSHSDHRDHRISEGHLLESLGELRLYIPPIETLPQELLLQVFEQLVHPSLLTAGFPDKQVIHYSRIDDYLEDDASGRSGRGNVATRMPVDRTDLRNVCLVSRKFKLAATTLLYRCAHLATAKSPGSFLLTLTAHPDLQPLVKHISVPWYIGVITDRFDFAFSHDTTNLSLGMEDDLLPDELEAEFVAECGENVGGDLLRLTMPLVPNLRTLVIPQTNLLDGPFTNDLVLPYLTMLRITLMAPNEAIFLSYDFHHAVRTITWLSPDLIGHHFPALQRLEICSPTGQWEADLVSEEVETAKGRSLWKYVESLKTTTAQMAPADWDLMSLKRPIFHPSKFHTLEFDGPGEFCGRVFNRVADIANWNFDRFFTEKGDGLRTLSLDWELHDIDDDDNSSSDKDPEEAYFGNMGHLTTLHKLTNLTHLTVSLQALFGVADKFQNWVDNTKASPDTELSKLLPPSLRTLRIAEYILGVYEISWFPPDEEEWNVWERDHWVCSHNDAVYHFLQSLRAFWLLRDERRELWFRRYAALDQLTCKFPRHRSRGMLAYFLDDTAERDQGFERVLRPPEDMVWVPEGDDDSDDDPDWEDGETTDGSDDGMTESEDEDPDGDSDQKSDGEKVGLYQDGKLVLV